MSHIEDLLKSAVEETGADLEKDVAEIAAYAAERTAVLATLVGLPGYALAVIAERDNVAMFAGLHAVAQSDKTRERITGIIQGALFITARSLAESAGA